jgi:hypothetical protein
MSTRVAGAGLLAALSLALAACSSSSGTLPSTTTAPAATSTSASPTPTPSATAAAGIASDASPFSGRAHGAGKPVLVVKFDNTTFAQPHAGLQDADLVYIEEVEYGLTRIAAVFSTSLPRVVGPVRSARISDIDLLAQFGRPAFAYSGSQHKLRPLLAKASLYDVSGDMGPSGYFRDGARRPPYNFMGVPKALLARAPHASAARDIGFAFSVPAPDGGTPIKQAVVPYPASQAMFVWNRKAHAFDVYLNKRPARSAGGGTQHATTAVIQFVKQSDSGFHDKYGGRTPLLQTVGSGKAWVLRDGRAWLCTWSRPSTRSGTTFTTADGQRMLFAPGQVWVALANTKAKVRVR